MGRSLRLEGCYIPEEILVQILCCLPKKSLCRFKCVSKQWCNLISNPNLARPMTNPAGFLLQEGRRRCRPSFKFLRLDNKGGASVDHSIRFNVNMTRVSSICDSCNGFLLICCTFTENRQSKEKYIVYNPITESSVHEFSPVYLPISDVSLVCDGNCYKATHFSLSSKTSHLVFSVYSLEDKKWKEKELESPLCYTRSFHDRIPVLIKALFFKGAMHWTLNEHILVYHLKDEFCKAIELPTFNPGHRCIWEFEGRLHQCHASSNTINIWVLHMVDQKKYVPSQQCFAWQHKHKCLISLPYSEIGSNYSFLPFAFHEDFEILYIRCRKGVISYILSTGQHKVAYVFPKSSTDFILMKQPYTLVIDRGSHI